MFLALDLLLLAACASLVHASPIAARDANVEGTSPDPYASPSTIPTPDSYASSSASLPFSYAPLSTSIDAVTTPPTIPVYQPAGSDFTQPLTTLATTKETAAISPSAYGMGSGISTAHLTASTSVPAVQTSSTSVEKDAVSTDSKPPVYQASSSTPGFSYDPITTTTTPLSEPPLTYVPISSPSSSFVSPSSASSRSAVPTVPAYGVSSAAASDTSPPTNLPSHAPMSSMVSTVPPYGSSGMASSSSAISEAATTSQFTTATTEAFTFAPTTSAASSAPTYGSSSTVALSSNAASETMNSPSASATMPLPSYTISSLALSSAEPSFTLSSLQYSSSKPSTHIPSGYIGSTEVSPVQSSRPFPYSNSSSTVTIPQYVGSTTSKLPQVSTAASATFNYEPVETSAPIPGPSSAPSYTQTSPIAPVYSSEGLPSAAPNEVHSTTFLTMYTTVYGGQGDSPSSVPSYGFASSALASSAAFETDAISQHPPSVQTPATNPATLASTSRSIPSAPAVYGQLPSSSSFEAPAPSTLHQTMTTTTSTTTTPSIALPSVVIPSSPIAYSTATTSTSSEKAGITIVPVSPSGYFAPNGYSADAKEAVTVTVTEKGAKETVTVTAPCNY
ncbi:uncharacterized protein RCC_12169 [Ramularia collo-cygni]|uniref:REJ domain-containing protein n=1 Tax=Ramularia collo-cygni TaxID=112498 RepID=A0A2D3UUB7_9PEZI|nr:uncharacterized protein RCC_12169 [Ramularia collo-cygni]CZT14466.1 uncharacterized protein RCC_12169 [Ramularia collo-cygni]